MILEFLHPYLLLSISVTANAVCNTVMSAHSRRYGEQKSAKYAETLAISLFTAIFLFALGGFKFYVSTYSLILGMVFGLVNCSFTVISLKAYKLGPMSLTVVIINFSTVFTAISGAVIYGEQFNPLVLIALAFLLASSVFCAKKETGEKKANILWLFLSVTAMVLSTFVGLLQKAHQTSEHKNELISFLIVSFVFSTLFSLVALIVTKNVKPKMSYDNVFEPFKKERNFSGILLNYAVFGLIAGLCTAINHAFNLYLSGIIPTATFFPLVNGIPLALSIVFGFIFLKEKLNKNQIVGLILGVVGIIFIIAVG